MLLYISNGVRYGLSTGKTLQKILFVPLSISVLLISEQLSFASYNDLTCALAKRFPIVPAINGFDSETCGREEQQSFTTPDVSVNPSLAGKASGDADEDGEGSLAHGLVQH